ncbi:hypothetical protein [Labrenzia sp. R5_0]|uniref:hypothetical protein n=1 Tax=Labrenzia sp. R5_0 TaxID=2821108 RepID=UPI001ADAA7E2|nr:hypothetical protein [Labrenzia sp. R5_0]MBO9461161.1 hypothetical protein [Labrenzia sp. R5_0]
MEEKISKPSPASKPEVENYNDRVLEFKACEFYLGAERGEANRFSLRKALDVDIEIADTLTMRLKGRIFSVVNTKPLFQVIPLELEDVDLSYFADLSVNEINILNNYDKLSSLYEKLKNNNYQFYLSELEKQIKGLSPNKRQLLSAYVKALAAEDVPPLEKAPELYIDKKTSGEIIDFLNRVYGPYMDGISFGRKELSQLDTKAHNALGSYETRVRKVPLEELNLPTASQKIDQITAGFTERQLAAASTVYKTKRRRSP